MVKDLEQAIMQAFDEQAEDRLALLSQWFGCSCVCTKHVKRSAMVVFFENFLTAFCSRGKQKANRQG